MAFQRLAARSSQRTVARLAVAICCGARRLFHVKQSRVSSSRRGKGARKWPVMSIGVLAADGDESRK